MGFMIMVFMGVPCRRSCAAGRESLTDAQLQLDTLRVKIQSCLTFASLAQLKYEILDLDAERFLADGYQEFRDLRRLSARCVDLLPEVRQQVQAEIAQADERLHEVERFGNDMSVLVGRIRQTTAPSGVPMSHRSTLEQRPGRLLSPH